jgi:hypothetical protein
VLKFEQFEASFTLKEHQHLNIIIMRIEHLLIVDASAFFLRRQEADVQGA